jgi:glutamine synthetase
MGEEVHAKLVELKLAQAERCPKALGTCIKSSEVQFHHEVTNQFLSGAGRDEPLFVLVLFFF